MYGFYIPPSLFGRKQKNKYRSVAKAKKKKTTEGLFVFFYVSHIFWSPWVVKEVKKYNSVTLISFDFIRYRTTNFQKQPNDVCVFSFNRFSDEIVLSWKL